MAGKPNTQWRTTMLAKYDNDPAKLRAHMQSLGSKGGKLGVGHKFAHGKVDPSIAGKVGGTKSRKGKATP